MNTDKRLVVSFHKPVSRSVSLAKLAELTEGYASAEIADICEKVAMIPLGKRIKKMTFRREITMEDFDQVLKEENAVLASWYSKAVKELSTGESEMFRELIEAAREYRKEGGKNGN